jgi:hypothetical protein
VTVRRDKSLDRGDAIVASVRSGNVEDLEGRETLKSTADSPEITPQLVAFVAAQIKLTDGRTGPEIGSEIQDLLRIGFVAVEAAAKSQ